MLVIKGAPFAVYGHGGVGWEVHVRELGDRTAVLHVGRVTPGAEDAADLHLGVGVG